MKMRALALLCVVVLGGAAWAQMTGDWDFSLKMDFATEDITFTTTLTLNYTVEKWTLTSISEFDETGYNSQVFKVVGEVGPANVTGEMKFDPTVPKYLSSYVKGSLDFAGVGTSLKVSHSPEQMDYDLTINADPFKAELSFVDYCTGIQFEEATISLESLSLCCGITYDVELSFNKTDGFDYLKFTVENFFDLCCGISFDLSVKFTTSAKEVSLTPKWAGLENCITVYGDVQWEGNKVAGLDIYGWKVKCTFGDCTYLEVLTALEPTAEVFNGIFEGDEFQYIEASFCGPGCCGGTYSVTVKVYFDNGGGLFGLSRFVASMEAPLMDKLTLKATYSSLEPSLTLGWSFEF